jgi:hypothetical protein
MGRSALEAKSSKPEENRKAQGRASAKPPQEMSEKHPDADTWISRAAASPYYPALSGTECSEAAARKAPVVNGAEWET